MKNSSEAFLHAAELIAGADALVVAAGAGMGVDSGLPDFRGNEGFWKAYPALARANLNFMDVADPRTFETDPQLAWGFYGHRLDLYRLTVPHAGFNILRKWGELMPLGHWVFTSNVDGQFQKAGFSDDHIHECHGSIHHLQCMNQCESGVWSVAGFNPIVDHNMCHLLNSPPLCPVCGELARPNIVMFGDWGYQHNRSEEQRRCEDRWLNSIAVSQARVVIVELGAGKAIPSVRHFSHRISREYGARIIRINPCDFQVPSSMDVSISCGALAGLEGIDSLMESWNIC